MTKILTFNSRLGNKYIHINSHILFLHPELECELGGDSVKKEKNDYYKQKLQFLKQKAIINHSTCNFSTKIDPEWIKNHVGNLKQLLIEVTDECNLACKYCGYREYYENYDYRYGKKQSFEKVKPLLDYLFSCWKSTYNNSYGNIITLGFYGGEPLLNMELIKQIIEYIEQQKIESVNFLYNMTTNGMLIHKYIDFLSEKKIKMLISLDGNKHHNSYRITTNGKESFNQIHSNVHKLKDKYPKYFDECVNFNAVLHNRNTFEDISNYIFTEFGKVARISELSMNGIAKEKEIEFIEMFQSKLEASKNHKLEIQSNVEELLNNSEVDLLINFIDSFTDNTFDNLEELFYSKKQQTYIPTGTCQPFQRKMFLTVNGKLLPCEKIGQKHILGHVDEKAVKIDFSAISSLYEDLYSQILNQCKTCFMWNNCGQCIFLLPQKNNRVKCHGYLSKSNAAPYLSRNISLLENNPFIHERLINEVISD